VGRTTTPRTGRRIASSRHTANLAIQILTEIDPRFREPTRAEKSNLLVAFAKKNKVLYGNAFDLVRCPTKLKLTDTSDVERHLDDIKIYAVKSTRLDTIGPQFRNYFFSLSTAELLTAQSLKRQYRFAFVNTVTRNHIELSLHQVFSKARIVYPEWAIRF
jgi:hypothetical protein